MSPTLSRENYFLDVINQLDQHHVGRGSLEQELQELLLDLVESVRVKKEISALILQRINGLFERYPAVRLKVRTVSGMGKSPVDEPMMEQEKEQRQQILLHTEFVDGADELKRMYMESIISLLEALEKKPLHLQKCIQCDRWFIPYQRAQVAKFCSSKCRNRFNYVLRNRDNRRRSV